MKSIVVYIPASHLEAVKAAMFQAGAGRIGNYDSCSWEILGEGQFRPLAASQPYIGEQGKIEKVPEYRVEMVCEDNLVPSAIAALKAAHPYETPAFLLFENL